MKRMMLSVILISLFATSGIFQSENCRAADLTYYQVGTSPNVKTLNEVITLLENSNPDIQMAKLENDAKVEEYRQAVETESDCNELYSDCKGLADSDTLESAREQYLQALLNRELLSYYVTYMNGLLTYATKVKTYEFMNLYYQLIVLDKKVAFYKANATYLSTYKSIVNIKYKHGKSTKLDLQAITLEKEENAANLTGIESERQEVIEALSNMIGADIDFSVKLPLNTEAKNYNLYETVSCFEKNDYRYEEADNTKKAYYSCNICEKAVIGSYTYNRNMQYMKYYSLQAEKCKMNISLYAKARIRKNTNNCKKMKVASDKLSLNETKVNNIKRKYEKGKASKLDLYKAKATKAEAEVTYYNVLSEKILNEYILDEGLYIEN